MWVFVPPATVGLVRRGGRGLGTHRGLSPPLLRSLFIRRVKGGRDYHIATWTTNTGYIYTEIIVAFHTAILFLIQAVMKTHKICLISQNYSVLIFHIHFLLDINDM